MRKHIEYITTGMMIRNINGCEEKDNDFTARNYSEDPIEILNTKLIEFNWKRPLDENENKKRTIKQQALQHFGIPEGFNKNQI